MILTVSNGYQSKNRKAPLWAELLIRFVAWKVLSLPLDRSEPIKVTLWRPARPVRVREKAKAAPPRSGYLMERMVTTGWGCAFDTFLHPGDGGEPVWIGREMSDGEALEAARALGFSDVRRLP